MKTTSKLSQKKVLIMIKAILTTLVVTLLTSISAIANDEVKLTESYSASELRGLAIKNGVGSIEIKCANISSIEVEVTVEPTTSFIIFESDISAAKLNATTKKGLLELEVPLDDSEQHWVVRVPQHVNLLIDLGVGEVDVTDINQDFTAKVGVGEFSATLNQNSFKSINAETGVGGVSLSGFSHSENDSHLVGNSAQINGEGSAILKVDVGVGGINLKTEVNN